MKPEELLDFVKACSKHWLRPVSMLVAFKLIIEITVLRLEHTIKDVVIIF